MEGEDSSATKRLSQYNLKPVTRAGTKSDRSTTSETADVLVSTKEKLNRVMKEETERKSVGTKPGTPSDLLVSAKGKLKPVTREEAVVEGRNMAYLEDSASTGEVKTKESQKNDTDTCEIEPKNEHYVDTSCSTSPRNPKENECFRPLKGRKVVASSPREPTKRIRHSDSPILVRKVLTKENTKETFL